MAAHAMRYQPARRRRRWPKRMLGFLATVALLGSGAAIAYMVMPARDDGAAAKSPPATKPKPAAKGAPALTKAQKRARHDAVVQLTGEGYDPVRLADWRPKAALKVLVGRDEQGAMRGFFFAGGKFLGHDDAATSNDIRVAKGENGAVTLSYGVSTGGRERVRFTLENGALAHTDPVPPSTVR
jgi:hypothetical protein